MSNAKGRLVGRRALIAGVASGRGRETACFFVAEGTANARSDRVVQSAAKLVPEPLFEADFENSAYG